MQHRRFTPVTGVRWGLSKQLKGQEHFATLFRRRMQEFIAGMLEANKVGPLVKIR